MLHWHSRPIDKLYRLESLILAILGYGHTYLKSCCSDFLNNKIGRSVGRQKKKNNMPVLQKLYIIKSCMNTKCAWTPNEWLTFPLMWNQSSSFAVVIFIFTSCSNTETTNNISVTDQKSVSKVETIKNLSIKYQKVLVKLKLLKDQKSICKVKTTTMSLNFFNA